MQVAGVVVFMVARVLFLLLVFLAIDGFSQSVKPADTGSVRVNQSSVAADEMLRHLEAAESFQRSGDLVNAAIENRAILGFALQRVGNIAIERGNYDDAVKFLGESLDYADNAPIRTDLAVAYLRQNQLDKAVLEAQKAASADPNFLGAHYILANIYFTKEDYQAALPELERVFSEAPDFEIARALAVTYLNLKELDRAKLHFEKMVVSAGKENADLHVFFAKLYEKANYPAEAEIELKRARTIDPKKLKINFYLGYLLLQNGGTDRLPEAGAAFGQELKLTPNDFYSLFFSGVVALSLNDHRSAIPFLQQAIGVNPNSGEAYLFLGQSQIELEDLANAEKNLRRAIELEANGGKNTQARRTHFMLGRLLLRTDRREEAQKELAIAGKLQQQSLDSSRNEINRILGQVAERSESRSADDKSTDAKAQVKLAPERVVQLESLNSYLDDIIAQAFYNLGVIATQNERSAEAIKNFSAAYRWKPDFPNLSRNLGIVSFRAGEFEGAIAPLAQHLQTRPDDDLIRKMLGTSYYFTKNYAKAVEVLSPIGSYRPDNAELIYFYGISLIQLKRDREAKVAYDQLARNSQQAPEALFYASQGFMMLGDYDRAVTEFGRVISLAPNTPKANYFMGQGLIRLNRLADAEKAFSRELQIDPNDAASKYHLALTLIERKIDLERAISVLEEAISLRADYADAFYQLGKIYLEKGDAKKAVDNLEKAVLADADKDYVHYQLSIAYRKMSRKEDSDRELKIYQKLKNDERKMDKPMPMGPTESAVPKANK